MSFVPPELTETLRKIATALEAEETESSLAEIDESTRILRKIIFSYQITREEIFASFFNVGLALSYLNIQHIYLNPGATGTITVIIPPGWVGIPRSIETATLIPRLLLGSIFLDTIAGIPLVFNPSVQAKETMDVPGIIPVKRFLYFAALNTALVQNYFREFTQMGLVTSEVYRWLTRAYILPVAEKIVTTGGGKL